MGRETLQRPLLCFLFSILLIDLQFRIDKVSATSLRKTFCERAVASRSCASPPTFDRFNIEAYLGRWYEIGSSANFKLTREVGSVCDQAKYSNSSGKLSLVNSSLKVIGFSGMTAVRTLTSASSNVCNGARDLCYDLAPSSTMSEALEHVSKAIDNLKSSSKTGSALLLQTSQKLLSSLELTETALGSLAENVNRVQQSNGHISQSNADLKGSIIAIERYITRASKEQAIINALVGDVNKAESELTSVIKKLGTSEANVKHELEQAVSLLVETAQKVAGSSSAIAKSLTEIQDGAVNLLKEWQPIENNFVSFRDGTIIQNTSSAGKLEVDVNGVRGPTWILDVEEDGKGGYRAALIYSCTELKPARLDRSIFILSREPQLDKRIVDRFLKLAKSYGVYNDCESPFLFSAQRGGDCGRPAGL